jgi:hypothetical protein
MSPTSELSGCGQCPLRGRGGCLNEDHHWGFPHGTKLTIVTKTNVVWSSSEKCLGSCVRWQLKLADLNGNWQGLKIFRKVLQYHISSESAYPFSSWFMHTDRRTAGGTPWGCECIWKVFMLICNAVVNIFSVWMKIEIAEYRFRKIF